jgi:hypothetical protein
MAKLIGAYETVDHREVNGWTVTLFRNLSHDGTQPHGSFSATVREGVSEDVLSFYGETREAVEREVLRIVGVSPLDAAALVEENAALRAAAEEVLSWNTGDTSTLLSNPPQNAGLFHAQRVLRAALEKQPKEKPCPARP